MRPHITSLAVLAALAMTGSGCLAQAAQASTTAPAAARPQAATLLYNQDNNECSGCGVSSTNYGTGSADNSQGADDFTVPTGKTWTIAQVKVTQGPEAGTAASFTVFFYKNKVNTKKQDVPGTLVTKQTLKGKLNTTTDAVVISGVTGVKLTAGHYWLSVRGNGLQATAPNWFWATRTVKSGSPGVWENSGNGFGTGCIKWRPVATCNPGAGPDWMFALYGTG